MQKSKQFFIVCVTVFGDL